MPRKLFVCVMWAVNIVILGAYFSQISTAAEITDRNFKDCAVQLDGEIVEGDFAKLKGVFSSKRLNDGNVEGELENNHEEALCLNSNGGSYIESRKIAEHVHKYAVPTRIGSEAECYSACALIFMAGRVRGDEFDNPARYLNVKGKLGFHAPYWSFDKEKNFSASEVMKLTQLQNILVADLIRFGSFSSTFSYKPDISISLLSDMYASGPDEFAMVDTIEKVARWGVDLEGYTYKVMLDKTKAVQLCLSFQAWSKDETAITSTYKKTLAYLVDHQMRVETYDGQSGKISFQVVDTGGYAAQYCLIEIQTAATEYQQICVKDDFSGRHLGDCSENAGFNIPSYYSLPPDTPIETLR